MKSGAAAVLESRNGEALILQEVRAEAAIRDLFAEVTVTQRYRNPEPSNIEAVYTFPLPLDAVLLGFEVEIGDRKLVGTVVGKVEAERSYESAITGGDTAVLLEQAGPGLFTASLGNLLPGEEATLRFRYGLFLRWNGDRIRLMMPTTIAPRYGNPASAGLAQHQVPEYSFDAERSFSLKVAVEGLLSDACFASPTHEVRVAKNGGQTLIELAGTPAMDSDFVLEARAVEAKSCGALASADVDGKWVALASFRPEVPSAAERQRRSVKVVVDCSGSMTGDSIAQARLALTRILDGLRDGDFFDIVAFGDSHRTLFGVETEVSTASLVRARRFVRGLDANMGGTEIAAALEAAYALRGAPDLPRDLLLITDGEAWNAEALPGRASASGHRIFTVGVGSAVAEGLVRELAEASGGACELVTPREDMAERIHRHFQRLYAPAAKSATIAWPADPKETLPKRIETAFDGDTLHALAWFDEEPQGLVRLEIELADGRMICHETQLKVFADGADPTAATGSAQSSSLARIAAAHRLPALVDGEAATELAVRYQLISRWTNYLVTHMRAEGEKCDDLPEIRAVPQMVAAGWHGMGANSDPNSAALFCFASPTRDFSSWGEEIPASLRRVKDPYGTAGPLASTGNFRDVVPDFIAHLNSLRSLRACPRLKDLQHWGIPEPVLKKLEALVDAGAKEEHVATAFLLAVLDTENGHALNRPIYRQIVKALRSTAPNWSLVAEVVELVREWEGEGEIAEDTL